MPFQITSPISFSFSLSFVPNTRTRSRTYRYIIIIGKDKRISSEPVSEQMSRDTRVKLEWNIPRLDRLEADRPQGRGGKGRQRRASMDCRFPTTIIMCIARGGEGKKKRDKNNNSNTDERREKRGIAAREKGEGGRGGEERKKRCEKNGDSRYNVRCLDAAP